jgi:flagellar basal-body rod protein FlgG
MTDPLNAVSASLAGLNSRYEAIAHNLSNSSTPAFKRHRVRFEQALSQAAAAPSAASAAGTLSASPCVDLSPGAIEQTDRPLDFAISGKGYFVLESPQGKLYTRSGTFTRNANNQLVSTRGQIVAGESGPLVVPPNCPLSDVKVSADGQIVAGTATIGKLKIVDFADASLLSPAGAGCFQAPASAATTAAAGTLRQGYREMSNVNVAQELVELIQVTRLYEANLRNVSAADERTKNLIQVAMS